MIEWICFGLVGFPLWVIGIKLVSGEKFTIGAYTLFLMLSLVAGILTVLSGILILVIGLISILVDPPRGSFFSRKF